MAFWYGEARNNMARRTKVSPESIEIGQVWQMLDSKIHITLIGRTLVHYKHYKAGAVRVPVSLINKEALGDLLTRNKAVLVPG